MSPAPSIDAAWESPAVVPELEEGVVQIWRLRLGDHAPFPTVWRQALPTEERARATTFGRAADRERFTRTRAWLRVLLGHHLQHAPEEVSIRANALGKPILDPGLNRSIEFNVSHSGAWSLVALSPAPAVGVDVESAHRAIDPEALARRYFDLAFQSALHALPAIERARCVLEHWTTQEATVKATGAGVSAILARKVPSALEVPRFHLPMPEDALAAVAVCTPQAPHWRLLDGARLATLQS